MPLEEEVVVEEVVTKEVGGGEETEKGREREREQERKRKCSADLINHTNKHSLGKTSHGRPKTHEPILKHLHMPC